MIAEIQSEVFSQRYKENSSHSKRKPYLPTKHFEASSDSNELEKTLVLSRDHKAAAVPVANSVARESDLEGSSG